jgi:hypothetical protein
MSDDRRFEPLRYDVVKDCAEELIRLASSADVEERNAVEVLHERVPEASAREMQMAVEVALECVLGPDDPDDDVGEPN